MYFQIGGVEPTIVINSYVYMMRQIGQKGKYML